LPQTIDPGPARIDDVSTLDQSRFAGQDVEGPRACAFLNDLKSCVLQKTRPARRLRVPLCSSSGLKARFSQKSFVITIIRNSPFGRVSAHDAIERGSLKRELAHVARLNCGAVHQAAAFRLDKSLSAFDRFRAYPRSQKSKCDRRDREAL